MKHLYISAFPFTYYEFVFISYIRFINLANLNCLSEDGATGMSAWYVYTMRAATIRQSVGVCRVLYMYRRGLTALLILADGQCESLTSEISKNSSPRFFVI